MSIATLDNFFASLKQRATWTKLVARTTVANSPFSLFDVAGQPGAGTLAGSSTAAGVVPVDTDAGFPLINSFSGGGGHLGRVEFGGTVACRMYLYDCLFKAGAYSFNANTALSGQPSYSGRVPDGNYNGLEIWVETVTAFTGNQTWNVTYMDQDGNTGATTGAVGIAAAPTVGRMWQLPFAAGDSGVQKIENVLGGTGSAGTANILVLRPLASGRLSAANMADVRGIVEAGAPVVYDTSALYVVIVPDSTSSGVPYCNFQVASL